MTPPALAVIVTGVDVVTALVAIAKVALVAPCGTDTPAGTVAAALPLDRETAKPPAGAGDVHSHRDQRGCGQHWIRIVRHRNDDHAARHERPRRHLVGRLLERRQQDEDLHVHAERERVRHGQRAVSPCIPHASRGSTPEAPEGAR